MFRISTSSLPTTRTSSPLTTGIAPVDVHGRDEMRFMPIPGRPTPGAVPHEFVHTEFISTYMPIPPAEASHIEDRSRRPQRTRTHPPDYGTGHWYPSLVDSGTSQGTRVLQTWVPICLIFKKQADWYPSLVDSGTSQGTRVLQTRVPRAHFSDANY